MFLCYVKLIMVCIVLHCILSQTLSCQFSQLAKLRNKQTFLLWKRALKHSMKPATVFHWIPACCGIAGNKRADRLLKEDGRLTQHKPKLNCHGNSTLLAPATQAMLAEKLCRQLSYIFILIVCLVPCFLAVDRMSKSGYWQTRFAPLWQVCERQRWKC